MSQKTTRKSQNATAVTEEKEKADTPVKEMKKKIAANAEKDKQAAEKADKQTEKADKNESADKNKAEKANENKTDKNVDKTDKNTDKTDRNTDKTNKNAEKADKNADKSDKSEKITDKKSDKSGDKKADKPVEKDESKGDKAKVEVARAVNGHNGAANGADANGTVSDGSDGDLVIEEDEAFPELTYDDTDSELEDAPSRSLTRRSQSKESSKAVKVNDAVAASDRKLRSADSPKPDAKRLDKKQDSPRKHDAVGQEEEKKSTKTDLEASKKDLETKEQEDTEMKEQKDDKDEKKNKLDVDVVVVEAENSEGMMTRTRARVSPYSRTRLDRTTTSVMADYSGNNSTMEMDITESSSTVEDPALDESGYLRGLRAIRGRTSYKLLHEIKLTNPNAGRPRPAPPAATIRPLGAVVGRKRKPSGDSSQVELGEEATDDIFAAHGKRMKLLDRLSMPFRRTMTRRAAEIVGINTDLPLTAPVASTSFAAFDPETIKPGGGAGPGPRADAPVATPLPPPLDRDGKRCVVM